MKLYVYDHCPFCVRACMIFGLKNLPVELVVLANDDEAFYETLPPHLQKTVHDMVFFDKTAAQDYFVEEAKEKAKKKQEPDETHDRVFVPEEPVPDVED